MFVGSFSLAIMVVLVPLPLLFASLLGLVNIGVGYAIVFIQIIQMKVNIMVYFLKGT
jgi:hypothetical protein